MNKIIVLRKQLLHCKRGEEERNS